MLTFRLKRAMVPFRLVGDDGKSLDCALVEIGDELDQFLTESAARAEPKAASASADKAPAYIHLLTYCLYHATIAGEGDGAKVESLEARFTAEEVKALPSSAKMPLFFEAQRMSGLDDEAMARAKNGLSVSA